MTLTRHALIRARYSMREADDAMLSALMQRRDPEQFAHWCDEALEQLRDAAKELGLRLEPVNEKEMV